MSYETLKTMAFYFNVLIENSDSGLQRIIESDINQSQASNSHSFLDANSSKSTQFVNDKFQGLNMWNYNIKNEAFSPYSIFCVCNMLLQGATGSTKRSLIKVWCLNNKNNCDDKMVEYKDYINSLAKKKVKIGIINIMFHPSDIIVDERITDCWHFHFFKEVITDLEDSEKTLSEINEFIEKFSYDYLKNKVKNLFSNSPLVLMNIMYFQGSWLKKFKTSDTSTGDFTASDNTKYRVPMMKQTGAFKFRQTNTVMFLNMEILGSQKPLSCIICLPKKTCDANKFPEFEQCDLFRACEEERPFFKVNLEIPRFNIDGNYNLSKIISKYLGSNFIDDHNLELDNMFITENDTKFDLVHKGVLDFNESGICTNEAYSEYKPTIKATSGVNFKCNRPFKFYIVVREKDFVIPIFAGKYNGPDED